MKMKNTLAVVNTTFSYLKRQRGIHLAEYRVTNIIIFIEWVDIFTYNILWILASGLFKLYRQLHMNCV
jgi:hypothetical protein